MILDRILDLYREGGDAIPRGNPTGSRLGRCRAQLQLLTVPERSHPTPFPVRSRFVMEEGNRTESWLAENCARVLPGAWGLRQQPFYFRVPLLTDDEVAMTRHKLTLERGEPGRIWGLIVPGFLPPAITRVEPDRSGLVTGEAGARVPERARWRVRGIGDKGRGLVLDPEARVVWIPVYLDAVVLYDDEPAIVEVKSRSNAGFRRFVSGSISYEDRMQMAGALSATGFRTVIWLVHRKETSHLAEVIMTRRADVAAQRVRITIKTIDGKTERYYSEPVTALVPVSGEERETAIYSEHGHPASLPSDATWDTAQVEVPHAPRLIEEARERVRGVLAWPIDGEPFREFGPTFRCATCEATGTQRMRKDRSGPLKEPKSCPDCGGVGIRSRVQLPVFPCGYCPVVLSCWPGVELEITDRPRYFVDRLHCDGIPIHTPASY